MNLIDNLIDATAQPAGVPLRHAHPRRAGTHTNTHTFTHSLTLTLYHALCQPAGVPLRHGHPRRAGAALSLGLLPAPKGSPPCGVAAQNVCGKTSFLSTQLHTSAAEMNLINM